MCKNNINKRNQEFKLTSTAPVCDEKQFGAYADILQQQVKSENVFNIGIIATYGAGKSSLLKTFKEKRLSYFKRKKVTTISLANFNSPNEQTDDKNSKAENSNDSFIAPIQDIECNIEKSILEQFLFKESKSKLPHSRIKRIDNRHFWLSLLIALMMTATIGLVCCGVLECLYKLPFSDGSNFYFFFGFAAGCVLLLIFMLLYSNRLNKISVKDIQADICDNSNYSVLNTFIDEILYYFKKTKTNIVIIEDLDRFDNTHIFSKLRELNFLINNSKIVRQKVTFIYAVKDTLFKDENDRAKFFDYIISLVPILSFTNARNLLDKEMKKLCSDYMLLPDEFVKEVSHFITEMRILKNIINDYITYYKILKIQNFKNDDKNIKLFSLILYKNLRPADYAELQFDKGRFANLFEIKNQNIKFQIQKLQSELSELENKLSLAKDIKLNSFKIFKSLIKGMIMDSQHHYSTYLNYTNIDNISTFKQIETGIYVSGYYSYGCTIKDLENQLGDTLLNFENRIKEKATINLDNINSELTQTRTKIKELLNSSMQEYLKEDAKFNLDELESFLLTNGFISEDYKDFVAHADQDLLSSRDSEFVRSVLAKRPLDYGFKLDNPLNIIMEIQRERFSDKFALNFELVIYLLNYNGSKIDIMDKRDKLIKFLSSRESVAEKFIHDFISNGCDIELFANALIPENKYFIFDRLNDEELAENLKTEIIKILIKNFSQAEIVRQNFEENINSYLNYCPNVINEIGIINKSKFINLANYLKLKIQNLECSEENFDVAKDLMLYNLYELNEKNLQFIVCSLYKLDYEQYVKAPLTAIQSIQDSSFGNIVNSNIGKILDIILNFKEQALESQETLENLLNTETLPSELLKKFIDKQSIRYNFFTCKNIEYLEYMFDTDKIVVNWENILQAAKEGIDWDKILNFIIVHAEELSGKELTDKDLIIDLCNDECFENLEDFEKLSKSFHADLDISEINEDNILAILIKNTIIQSDKQNFISLNKKPYSIVNMLLINPDLVEDIEETSFNNDTVEYVIVNDSLNDTLKSKIIQYSSYIPNSQQAIEKTFSILKNYPISTCSYTLLTKIIQNIQTSIEDKLRFIEKNDSNLTKEEYMDLLTKVDANLSALKTEKEVKLSYEQINNEIMTFLENKNLCKVGKYKFWIKITKKY